MGGKGAAITPGLWLCSSRVPGSWLYWPGSITGVTIETSSDEGPTKVTTFFPLNPMAAPDSSMESTSKLEVAKRSKLLMRLGW